jgi:serine/threonine protein kinase
MFFDNYYHDCRVEGTPAYLPPEVLRGRASLLNTNADAWALGCVAHFCLQGRPLYFGDKEEVF